jgi:hypothetical protein
MKGSKVFRRHVENNDQVEAGMVAVGKAVAKTDDNMQLLMRLSNQNLVVKRPEMMYEPNTKE